MTNEYKKFLGNKGISNFWKKAKQYEYDSADKIVFSLQNFEELTTRNSITLRMLGLVENLGSDNLKITKSGKIFLDLENKQEVLDEQLLKIFLASSINNRLKIKVFPLGIICLLFIDLDYITFEEYKIFVCWINNIKEVPVVINLIRNFRKLNKLDKSAIEKIFDNKVLELEIKNFADNIYRLFKMFTLSSYIRTEGNRYNEYIYRNSTPKTYKILFDSLKKISIKNYIHDLTHYKKIINQKADYDNIVNPIHDLSNEDRAVLFEEIREKKSLPDIRNISPITISPKIIERKTSVKLKKSKITKKIDYIARDTRNRLVGLHAESIVYKFEYNRLVKAGLTKLAQKIVHESLVSDSLGYDITSYNNQGIAKHIEVKAVNGLPSTVSFFISKNELDMVKNDPAHQIYIVFNYKTVKPEIWEIPHLSTISKLIAIDSVKFQVTLKIER